MAIIFPVICVGIVLIKEAFDAWIRHCELQQRTFYKDGKPLVKFKWEDVKGD